MDADVLSIETSRSEMELFSTTSGDFAYPNEIGPGVYDIHSPRVPTRRRDGGLLERAGEVLPAERLWVNPDCGLKTRGWPEVERRWPNGGGGEDHPHAARWKISLTKTTGCPLKDPLRRRPTSWRLDASSLSIHRTPP